MRARRLLIAVVVGGAIAAACAPAVAQPLPLGGRCLLMAGAGHAVCRSPPVVWPPPPVGVAPAPAGLSGHAARAATSRARLAIGFADFAAAYSLYRLLSATDSHRGCRLQPTCSLFAAQAARRFGFWRGLLIGLARAQMEHGDQGGWLPRALASDGDFIFLDPVERWIPGEP
ncbi:MAG TPA: membrane protein insertion efficiency factor YidD [Polyangia bacterium]|nr:membrane protein insertion efficiency factor YidD [Polyangia bacterium]